MALMGYQPPKRRTASFGQAPGTEQKSGQMMAGAAPKTTAKSFSNVPMPGGDLDAYVGNYGNLPPTNWVNSPGPYGNRYIINPDGTVSANTGYTSNPFRGRPTAEQLANNPGAYGGDTPLDPNAPTFTPSTQTPAPSTTAPAPTTTAPAPTTTAPPTGTPPGGIGGVAPPQPGTGGTTPPTNLPTPGGTGTGGTPSGGSPSSNTTPTSTGGAVPNVTNNIPGTTGPITQQRPDDLWAALTNLFLARDNQLGGAAGAYGNNFDANGNLVLPEWLQQGLISQFNAGANTNATTRQVQGDETVEGRLGKLMRSDNELNTIAQQRAAEQAAASGMLGGSTAAAGAALRASREAMLPIAQQDAQWYGQTARDNMDASNRDALSDQEIRSGLLQRDSDIRANLYEAASDRTWRAKEANQVRTWQSFENNLSYLRQSVDREDQQDFQWATREDDQAWTAWENDLNRRFQRVMQDDQQEFQGTESERGRAQDRTMAYFNMMFGRESMFSGVIQGIYSNPELTPAQQQSAAANARELFTSLWEAFNATLGQGMPEIFTSPYPINQQPNPTNP